MKNITAQFDRLFGLFSAEDFLERRGVSTEVPFFICHYDPKEQVATDEVVKLLHEKLNTQGIKTLHVDLYDMMVGILKKINRLDWLLQNEARFPHSRLLQNLRGQIDVKTVVTPMVESMIKSSDCRLVFVTGVGACYPIFEAHELLTNLSEIVSSIPLVLFFPGDYVQTPGSGASLHLFGRVEGRGYYRAFDVETFIKMRN